EAGRQEQQEQREPRPATVQPCRLIVNPGHGGPGSRASGAPTELPAAVFQSRNASGVITPLAAMVRTRKITVMMTPSTGSRPRNLKRKNELPSDTPTRAGSTATTYSATFSVA